MTENSKIIKEIVKGYFVSKKQCENMSFSSGSINYSNPYYIYYRNVELAFMKLDEDEKLIINNDYFYNDYFGWWKYIYTEREYNKLKRKAEKNFLRYFYEIR